jgi:hypothetical protein
MEARPAARVIAAAPTLPPRGFEDYSARASQLGASGHQPLAWGFLRFRGHGGQPVKGRLALQLRRYLPWALGRAQRRQPGSASSPAPASEVLQVGCTLASTGRCLPRASTHQFRRPAAAGTTNWPQLRSNRSPQGTALAAFQSWQALVHSAGGHSSAAWVPQGADAEAWQRQERVNAAAAAAASGPLQLPSWPPPRYPAALHVVVSETRLQVGMQGKAARQFEMGQQASCLAGGMFKHDKRAAGWRRRRFDAGARGSSRGDGSWRRRPAGAARWLRQRLRSRCAATAHRGPCMLLAGRA